MRVLEGHAAGQVALSFHPRAPELLTGSNRELRRWHAQTGAALGEPRDVASSVHHLSHSPDGSRIAAGLANADLEIWHTDTGDVLLRTTYRAGVWFTGWTPDGQGLLALPMDETVRVLWGR